MTNVNRVYRDLHPEVKELPELEKLTESIHHKQMEILHAIFGEDNVCEDLSTAYGESSEGLKASRHDSSVSFADGEGEAYLRRIVTEDEVSLFKIGVPTLHIFTKEALEELENMEGVTSCLEDPHTQSSFELTDLSCLEAFLKRFSELHGNISEEERAENERLDLRLADIVTDLSISSVVTPSEYRSYEKTSKGLLSATTYLILYSVAAGVDMPFRILSYTDGRGDTFDVNLEVLPEELVSGVLLDIGADLIDEAYYRFDEEQIRKFITWLEKEK